MHKETENVWDACSCKDSDEQPPEHYCTHLVDVQARIDNKTGVRRSMCCPYRLKKAPEKKDSRCRYGTKQCFLGTHCKYTMLSINKAVTVHNFRS